MSEPLPRHHYSTGTPWESLVGYARAVKIGTSIWVSGTTAATPTGTILAVGDPYGQTVVIIRKIEQTLIEAGASLKDIVRTRLYITETSDWDAVGRAHGEFFREIRPASTLVVVKALVDSRMLVEMEADAVLS